MLVKLPPGGRKWQLIYPNMFDRKESIDISTLTVAIQSIFSWFLIVVYFLVRWYASAVSLPSGDAIFAQSACPLNDVIFLHQD
jgi:hypothetical protein